MTTQPRTSFDSDLHAKLVEMAGRIGQKVATNARNRCPVKTGKLKNSIAVEQDDLTVRISATAPYVFVIEYGSRNQRAQPFLRPALDDLRGNVLRKVK